MRIDFHEALERGDLSLADACRMMRKITGLTQAEYAKITDVAMRTLVDLERGCGNPTIQTIEKIGKPFGLRVVFRGKRF